jgi:hypothetical protein
VSRSFNNVVKLNDMVSIKDFGAVGDGTTDDTAAIQAALDSVGNTQVSSNSAFQDIARKGMWLFIPGGCYRVTATLVVPNNVHIVGTGSGSQFRFDPSVPNSDFMVNKRYAGGGALSRSSVSLRFEKFYVYVAFNGGTTTGRDGSSLPTVNANSRHCFHITDGTNVSFDHVMVTDFHYGTAFRIKLDALFAYYNVIHACYGRDNFVMAEITSATEIANCFFGHGVNFPAASRMPLHHYMIDLTGARGCSIHGGSVEGYAATALINDNGACHSITGLYMEAFSPTPTQINVSLPNDAGQVFHGGNSYGFTKNRNVPVLVARTGSDAHNFGMNLNFGDYEELEICQSTTRQSPSFRYGIPGNGHFPAGGTLAVSSTSFIDRTSIELSRAAGTAATANQCSYVFKIRGGQQVVTNVWITALVKLEGGENNIAIRMTDPSNANFTKMLTYDNGWELWAVYVTPATDQLFTVLVSQEPGSTDSARKLRFTALRAYTNGFAPIPAAYKGLEYRTVAPTAGDWLQGDVVFNSQPSAGGTLGWMCVASGTPGTWVAVGEPATTAVAATAIAAVGNAINTTGKYAGRQVWDTTNNRMMRARGTAAADPWDVIDGSASVTPS